MTFPKWTALVPFSKIALPSSVVVVVPSPHSSLHLSEASIMSLQPIEESFEPRKLIDLATVTPSLVMTGFPLEPREKRAS